MLVMLEVVTYKISIKEKINCHTFLSLPSVAKEEFIRLTRKEVLYFVNMVSSEVVVNSANSLTISQEYAMDSRC